MSKDIRLGIIGSAGRKDDAPKVCWGLYHSMIQKAKDTMHVLAAEHDMYTMCLVSGGAAFADHIAVALFMEGDVLELELKLPCQFDPSRKRFVEGAGGFSSPGSTINFYHRKFSEALQFDSLNQLAAAMQKPGCFVRNADGFLARNTLVAERSHALLAMTFGNGPIVKPGGTADTIRKFLALPERGPAFHMDLSQRLCYRNARVA